MATRRLVVVKCGMCGWHRQADADLFCDELRERMMALLDEHFAAHAESCARQFEFAAGD